MAQLSIFDKQRHHSEKDMTVSIGKNEVIYITFRNDAWKLFTKSEKIAVSVKVKFLTFGDPEEHDNGVVFKLGRNTSGFPETKEHTRYLQINGKAWPAFLDAARLMLGSIDLSEARYAQRVKAWKMLTMPKELTEEKAKELVEKCCKEVTLGEPEDLPKFFTPSGFIELHYPATGERFVIKISDIQEVAEVLPEARRPSDLSPEAHGAKTIVYLAHGVRLCLETYDEVINKINSEV